MTDSTAADNAVSNRSVHSATEPQHGWPGATRRGVQVALGGLWLEDAGYRVDDPHILTVIVQIFGHIASDGTSTVDPNRVCRGGHSSRPDASPCLDASPGMRDGAHRRLG